MGGNRAVFLDRDGIINEEVGYVNHRSRFILLPGAAEAVRRLNGAGMKTVVVTNQSGVARGYFPESLVLEVNGLMKSELERQGAVLDGIYFCPHLREGKVAPYNVDCDCRKPKDGMLRRAASELSIDICSSYMVGDRLTDVEFGQRAGMKGILALTGYGMGEYEYHMAERGIVPDFVARDLADAARWILADAGVPERD